MFVLGGLTRVCAGWVIRVCPGSVNTCLCWQG